ncbi:hypothetical protein [Novosphingobium lindaniclasticum]|jgi:hypothetical protein|uniref:hypothetical protein n=1 Tax=Novosphingobium lindaniclasticum TaxID=1329895 RepID=UPI00240928FB|nr:hypothetical protein [Novosphingobium lindaniclasticum]
MIPQPAPVIPSSHQEAPPRDPAFPGRNMWSPDIRHDPYVVQEQMKIVEQMERECRIFKKNCALAGTARQSLIDDAE